MDIVLNTFFNNSDLPRVVRPGFFDDFNRVAGTTLGSTTDGKPWNYSSPSTPWKITADGHASPEGGDSFATVDGGSADGTLTAVVGKALAIPGTVTRGGIVFRWTDIDNSAGMYGNAEGRLVIYEREAGTVYTSSSTQVTLEDGDVLQAVMNGDQISVLHNGTVLHSWTSTRPTRPTAHGLATRLADSYSTFDSVRFEAA